MLFVHPIIQFTAILLSLYVLYLGFLRFRVKHLHQLASFPWKRHVLLGFVVLLVWLAGLVSGLVVVRTYWHSFLITGAHGNVAMTMLPFIMFGLASGLYMDRVKKKRNILPLCHGACNLIAVILALVQIRLGISVIQNYVYGG